MCLVLAKRGCEVTSPRLAGLDIQKYRLTSTVWSRELGPVFPLHSKMATTTYATCDPYTVVRILQRCSDGMRPAQALPLQ